METYLAHKVGQFDNTEEGFQIFLSFPDFGGMPIGYAKQELARQL
jgi:hypothetical protein